MENCLITLQGKSGQLLPALKNTIHKNSIRSNKSITKVIKLVTPVMLEHGPQIALDTIQDLIDDSSLSTNDRLRIIDIAKRVIEAQAKETTQRIKKSDLRGRASSIFVGRDEDGNNLYVKKSQELTGLNQMFNKSLHSFFQFSISEIESVTDHAAKNLLHVTAFKNWLFRLYSDELFSRDISFGKYDKTTMDNILYNLEDIPTITDVTEIGDDYTKAMGYYKHILTTMDKTVVNAFIDQALSINAEVEQGFDSSDKGVDAYKSLSSISRLALEALPRYLYNPKTGRRELQPKNSLENSIRYTPAEIDNLRKQIRDIYNRKRVDQTLSEALLEQADSSSSEPGSELLYALTEALTESGGFLNTSFSQSLRNTIMSNLESVASNEIVSSIQGNATKYSTKNSANSLLSRLASKFEEYVFDNKKQQVKLNSTVINTVEIGGQIHKHINIRIAGESYILKVKTKLDRKTYVGSSLHKKGNDNPVSSVGVLANIMDKLGAIDNSKLMNGSFITTYNNRYGSNSYSNFVGDLIYLYLNNDEKTSGVLDSGGVVRPLISKLYESGNSKLPYHAHNYLKTRGYDRKISNVLVTQRDKATNVDGEVESTTKSASIWDNIIRKVKTEGDRFEFNSFVKAVNGGGFIGIMHKGGSKINGEGKGNSKLDMKERFNQLYFDFFKDRVVKNKHTVYIPPFNAADRSKVPLVEMDQRNLLLDPEETGYVVKDIIRQENSYNKAITNDIIDKFNEEFKGESEFETLEDVVKFLDENSNDGMNNRLMRSKHVSHNVMFMYIGGKLQLPPTLTMSMGIFSDESKATRYLESQFNNFLHQINDANLIDNIQEEYKSGMLQVYFYNTILLQNGSSQLAHSGYHNYKGLRGSMESMITSELESVKELYEKNDLKLPSEETLKEQAEFLAFDRFSGKKHVASCKRVGVLTSSGMFLAEDSLINDGAAVEGLRKTRNVAMFSDPAFLAEIFSNPGMISQEVYDAVVLAHPLHFIKLSKSLGEDTNPFLPYDAKDKGKGWFSQLKDTVSHTEGMTTRVHKRSVQNSFSEEMLDKSPLLSRLFDTMNDSIVFTNQDKEALLEIHDEDLEVNSINNIGDYHEYIKESESKNDIEAWYEVSENLTNLEELSPGISNRYVNECSFKSGEKGSNAGYNNWSKILNGEEVLVSVPMGNDTMRLISNNRHDVDIGHEESAKVVTQQFISAIAQGSESTRTTQDIHNNLANIITVKSRIMQNMWNDISKNEPDLKKAAKLFVTKIAKEKLLIQDPDNDILKDIIETGAFDHATIYSRLYNTIAAHYTDNVRLKFKGSGFIVGASHKFFKLYQLDGQKLERKEWIKQKRRNGEEETKLDESHLENIHKSDAMTINGESMTLNEYLKENTYQNFVNELRAGNVTGIIPSNDTDAKELEFTHYTSVDTDGNEINFKDTTIYKEYKSAIQTNKPKKTILKLKALLNAELWQKVGGTDTLKWSGNGMETYLPQYQSDTYWLRETDSLHDIIGGEKEPDLSKAQAFFLGRLNEEYDNLSKKYSILKRLQRRDGTTDEQYKTQLQGLVQKFTDVNTIEGSLIQGLSSTIESNGIITDSELEAAVRENFIPKLVTKFSGKDGFVQTLNFLAGRIPAQAKQSIAAGRLKGFANSSYNNIYAPMEMLTITGADHDIDKAHLFFMEVDEYGEVTTFLDEWLVDGKFNQGRFDEFYNSLPNEGEKKVYNDLLDVALRNQVLKDSITAMLDPRNALESTLSMSFNETNDLKDELGKTELKIDKNGNIINTNSMSPYNAHTNTILEQLNAGGKEAVGMFANGIKGYSALYAHAAQYGFEFNHDDSNVMNPLNGGKQNYFNDLGLESDGIMFGKIVDGKVEKDFELAGIKNYKFADLSNLSTAERVEKAKQLLESGELDIEVSNGMIKSISPTSADVLSELLSAATDNANELILGAIGATGANIPYMVSMITYGSSLTDAVKFFNRPQILKIFKDVKENNGKDKNLLSVEIAAKSQALNNIIPKGVTHSSKNIKKFVKDNYIKGTQEFDLYMNSDAKKLHDIILLRSEFVAFSGMLSITQGVPADGDSMLRYTEKVRTAIEKVARKKGVTIPAEQYPREMTESIIRTIASGGELNGDEIDFMKFVDTLFTTTNPLSVLQSNRHYAAMVVVSLDTESTMRKVSPVNTGFDRLAVEAHPYSERARRSVKSELNMSYIFGYLKTNKISVKIDGEVTTLDTSESINNLVDKMNDLFIRGIGRDEYEGPFEAALFELTQPHTVTTGDGPYDRKSTDFFGFGNLSLDVKTGGTLEGQLITLLNNLKVSSPNLYKSLFIYNMLVSHGKAGSNNFDTIFPSTMSMGLFEYVANTEHKNTDLISLVPVLSTDVRNASAPTGEGSEDQIQAQLDAQDAMNEYQQEGDSRNKPAVSSFEGKFKIDDTFHYGKDDSEYTPVYRSKESGRLYQEVDINGKLTAVPLTQKTSANIPVESIFIEDVLEHKGDSLYGAYQLGVPATIMRKVATDGSVNDVTGSVLSYDYDTDSYHVRLDNGGITLIPRDMLVLNNRGMLFLGNNFGVPVGGDRFKKNLNNVAYKPSIEDHKSLASTQPYIMMSDYSEFSPGQILEDDGAFKIVFLGKLEGDAKPSYSKIHTTGNDDDYGSTYAVIIENNPNQHLDESDGTITELNPDEFVIANGRLYLDGDIFANGGGTGLRYKLGPKSSVFTLNNDGTVNIAPDFIHPVNEAIQYKNSDSSYDELDSKDVTNIEEANIVFTGTLQQTSDINSTLPLELHDMFDDYLLDEDRELALYELDGFLDQSGVLNIEDGDEMRYMIESGLKTGIIFSNINDVLDVIKSVLDTGNSKVVIDVNSGMVYDFTTNGIHITSRPIVENISYYTLLEPSAENISLIEDELEIVSKVNAFEGNKHKRTDAELEFISNNGDSSLERINIDLSEGSNGGHNLPIRTINDLDVKSDKDGNKIVRVKDINGIEYSFVFAVDNRYEGVHPKLQQVNIVVSDAQEIGAPAIYSSEGYNLYKISEEQFSSTSDKNTKFLKKLRITDRLLNDLLSDGSTIMGIRVTTGNIHKLAVAIQNNIEGYGIQGEDFIVDYKKYMKLKGNQTKEMNQSLNSGTSIKLQDAKHIDPDHSNHKIVVVSSGTDNTLNTSDIESTNGSTITFTEFANRKLKSDTIYIINEPADSIGKSDMNTVFSNGYILGSNMDLIYMNGSAQSFTKKPVSLLQPIVPSKSGVDIQSVIDGLVDNNFTTEDGISLDELLKQVDGDVGLLIKKDKVVQGAIIKEIIANNYLVDTNSKLASSVVGTLMMNNRSMLSTDDVSVNSMYNKDTRLIEDGETKFEAQVIGNNNSLIMDDYIAIDIDAGEHKLDDSFKNSIQELTNGTLEDLYKALPERIATVGDNSSIADHYIMNLFGEYYNKTSYGFEKVSHSYDNGSIVVDNVNYSSEGTMRLNMNSSARSVEFDESTQEPGIEVSFTRKGGLSSNRAVSTDGSILDLTEKTSPDVSDLTINESTDEFDSEMDAIEDELDADDSVEAQIAMYTKLYENGVIPEDSIPLELSDMITGGKLTGEQFITIMGSVSPNRSLNDLLKQLANASESNLVEIGGKMYLIDDSAIIVDLKQKPMDGSGKRHKAKQQIPGSDIQFMNIDTAAKRTVFSRLLDKLFRDNDIPFDQLSSIEIEIKYGQDLAKSSAFIHEGRVIINTDIATLDTPLHEFGGHIYMTYIKENDPELYTAIIDKALQSGYYDQVKELYPHLGEKELGEEIVANVLGWTSESLIKQFTNTSNSSLKLFADDVVTLFKNKDSIIDFIKKLFGRIISGKFEININEKDSFATMIHKIGLNTMKGNDLFSGLSTIKRETLIQGWTTTDAVPDEFLESLTEEICR